MSPSMEVLVGLIKSGQSIETAFKQAAIVSTIPTAGPNGETDLEFRYRKGTSDSGKPYEYYSVVCASAGMEFKFGQRQDGSGLFPKGWEPVYQNGNGGSQEGTVGGTIGNVAAPAPQPTPQPQNVAQPAPQAQVQGPAQAAPAPQANANQQASNSVLAKYGIGGQ